MTRVYLIRHGEIRKANPRCFIGRQDLPLTDQGRLQIARLAEYLEGKDIDRVVTSPLWRCLESADILCKRLPPMRPEVNANIQEISLGAWEGLTVAQVRARYPGEYERRGMDPLHFRPLLGESFADLLGRAYPSFQETVLASRDKGVAFVTHSGVMRVLLLHILGLQTDEIFNLKLDYGCLSVLDHDASGWRVESINLKP